MKLVGRHYLFVLGGLLFQLHYVDVTLHARVHIHAHLHVYANAYTYIYIDICIYTYIYICIYIYIYICMYCTFHRPAIQQTCACKSACPVSLLAFAVMAGKTRLTPFEVGQIAAHASHGLSLAEVASMVTRGAGSLGVSKETVRRALGRLKKDKTWRGDRKAEERRPPPQK